MIKLYFTLVLKTITLASSLVSPMVIKSKITVWYEHDE